MSEKIIVYRVKGNRGIWGESFNTLDMGKTYLSHIRKKFDKTAKLYEVEQVWKEVK